MSDFEFRYDMSPPTPYVYSVDSYGEVRVRFNQTMDPDAQFELTETGMGGRVLIDDSSEISGVDDDFLEVIGRASETF